MTCGNVRQTSVIRSCVAVVTSQWLSFLATANDLQVRHLATKKFIDLMVLLALWHATDGCKRSSTFDNFMLFYGSTVRKLLKYTKSTELQESKGRRQRQKTLSNEETARASFEMLVDEGFICDAQAGYGSSDH